MSTILLPCHKGLGLRTNDARASNGSNRSGGARLRPGQIPFVTHDNGKTRYYADRYYMDAPTALLEYQIEQQQQQRQRDEKIDYCDYCGEKRLAASDNTNATNGPGPARPLFDRAAFINSLDLSAAIIATYTIGDLEFLSDTFPALFPDPDDECKQHVPTLVLHGHRGWKLPAGRRSDKNISCPDEWDVEQEEADGELKPDVTKSNDEVMKLQTLDECSSSCDSARNEAEATNSTLKNNSAKAAETQTELNSQSHTNEAETLVHSAVIGADSNNAKPVLTYQGQSLDIRTTAKRRKQKISQAYQESFSPRRSPRLSDKRSKSIELESVEQSQRRSPRLNPTVKHEQKTSFDEQKSGKSGSTAMDAINLGSDTEDDECNMNQVESDAKLTCKTKPLYNETTKDTSPTELQTPPSSPSRNQIHKDIQLKSPLCAHNEQATSREQGALAPPASKLSLNPNAVHSRKRLKMTPAAAPSSAASILARSFGSVPDAKLMKPLNYPGDAGGSSDDDSINGSRYVLKSDAQPSDQDATKKQATDKKANAAKSVAPAAVFGGEVYFTQVLPRWIPPKDKKSLKKKQNNVEDGAPKLETVRGCHHPKFFLLFEKSGSLVVIVSTCNLTPQHAVDASWVQRFEPRGILKGNDGDIDYGMTHDFGYVLADLMMKQSAAAADGMLPDTFLRRFVDGLSSGGLVDLPRRFKFEDSHVHLVSTVPGDYSGHLPKKGVASCYNRPPYRNPSITYGPQRIAYILSRVMDKNHISVACSTIRRGLDAEGAGGTAAVTPWLPQSLLTSNERLVIQPTSMSGTWDRWELEIIVKSLLEPYWKADGVSEYNSPVELMDVIWPSIEHFGLMREKRLTLKEEHQVESWASNTKKIEKNTRGPCHVFLSSMAFSKLDRVCISRMALYESTNQPYMNSYESTSLHFKSICRMLKLTDSKASKAKHKLDSDTKCKQSREQEHISWFLLTSACLSKGAQGQPTPYRSLDSDSMSYANFELGVLFCSRILGDRVNDRLYVYDNAFSGGCQCGVGKRWYKDLLKNDQSNNHAFLNNVRKVHIPIPYKLRPKSYQQDPDSDNMSYTPYLHEILPGTGAVGNMKLTPYGRSVAAKNSSPSSHK
ncbi:hypothetical protein ACHAXN_006449 [Cyclotella atomus]|jgi:hypothetical protein